MKKNTIISYLFIFFVSFCFISNVKAVYSEDSFLKTTNYETELAKFPASYQEKIKALHNIYPNAIFVKQDMFFDWNKYKEVPVSWSDMLNAEKQKKRSEIEASAPANYRTSTCGEYSGSNCSWYIAIEEGISYYMNPYNFLDEKHVFMFQSQYYNSSYQTEAGVEKILAGTFMANKNCPGSDKTYAKVLMEAAEKYRISPYLLAARLRQENGSGTSPLVTGKCLTTGENCVKYYNFFNIQASGTTNEEKITNGLKCANGTLVNAKNQKLCNGYNWTTPYLSIMGGSQFLYKKYIGVNDTYNVKGQMNLYLQKWDVYGPVYGGHQYMQNIRAPYYESVSLYNSYTVYDNYKNFNYVFYIPIFTGAPNLTTGPLASGDVNGDGKISALDYVKIKNHIMGTNVITDENVMKAADYNNDGKISALDYVKIKNYIMNGGN